jgi:hypothetical protein
LSTDLSDYNGESSLNFNFEISDEDSGPNEGVDFAQIGMTITAVGDYYGDKDISNMVFYFGSDDPEEGCVKLKIDDFDAFWDNVASESGLDSTSTVDMTIDDATLKSLFNEFCGDELDAKYDLDGDGEWEDDWEFGGFSTKAGNNFDLQYAEDSLKKNANGEGEYYGDTSLAMECYGKKEAFACTIDAAEYDDGSGEWVSNIDALFDTV